MGFADQQLQIQVPYSPDDTFNALKASSYQSRLQLFLLWAMRYQLLL